MTYRIVLQFVTPNIRFTSSGYKETLYVMERKMEDLMEEIGPGKAVGFIEMWKEATGWREVPRYCLHKK